MTFDIDSAAQRRLFEFMDEAGRLLGNEQRRASFALYAQGLWGEGDRKSMEPIAARACPDLKRVDAEHQRLHHFVTCSDWDDRAIRAFSARYGVSAISERGAVEAWIFDDTGMLKQGKHSVGVQRQYTGSAGKIANCQLAVSLSVATATEHVPIDFELYLPRSWTEDEARREEAKIPKDVQFKTKIELASDMLDRAVASGIARGAVLADSFYGRAGPFRTKIRSHGLEYLLGIDSDTCVRPLDSLGRSRQSIRVDELAKKNSYRRFTWREGSKAALSARFAFQEVKLPEGTVVTLIIEWEKGEAAPNKFHVAAVNKNRSRKQLLRLLKQRWRTERVYQDLKGELGFDHFEGRRYRGWHHPISVVLCCFAFLVAERVRRFSPQSRRQSLCAQVALAA